MRKPFVNSGESGQAILEYVLMMSMAVGVVIIIGVGFRRSIFHVWKGFTREIAAACPGCPPNPDAKFN
jgi:predicted membrane protein